MRDKLAELSLTEEQMDKIDAILKEELKDKYVPLSRFNSLNEQKKKGVAVLFIGEDLDVLKSISDRLMVIHNGEIIDIVDPETVTKEDIGLMMLGHKKEEGDAV